MSLANVSLKYDGKAGAFLTRVKQLDLTEYSLPSQKFDCKPSNYQNGVWRKYKLIQIGVRDFGSGLMFLINITEWDAWNKSSLVLMI